MKKIFSALLLLLTASASAQDKSNYNSFNKLTPVTGTEYVLTNIENVGKMGVFHGEFLLFINTKTGKANRVDFPKNASLRRWEQVKLDSLGLNLILLTAQTVNLDNNRRIDWNDPLQLIVLSTDGLQKTQLTEDKFFVIYWTIHRETGGLVVSGYYDTNGNGKNDKTDKDEIQVYDLKTLKLISKI